ncbi:MAG: apolipoprotein N-acyltransferase [Syntrophobacterales bacterium]
MKIRQFFSGSPKHYLIAAFSGLLLTFCFPPIGHALIGWAVLVPLLFLATTNKPSVCFTLGWFAGICHGLSLLYWITYVVNHYGNLPLPVSLVVCFLLVAYLALFPGLFCAGLSWLRQRGLPWLLFAPFLWVTLEFGKSHLLTGFPWENLGYSQYRWLPLIQMADLAGVYGISFVLVLSSALLFRLIFGSKHQRKRMTLLISTLLLVGLFSVVYSYGRWRLATLESRQGQFFKVAMVQGNVSQDTKWDPAFQQATLEKYVRLTKEIASQQPDLVVWPETATPFYFLADRQNTKTLIQEVQKLKKPLLFGSPAYRRKGAELRLYNRAYLLDGDGMVTGYYDKIHLVPFGEYVPWQKILFFVDKLVQAAGNFASGKHARVLEVSAARVGVLICYEVIFPKLSRDLANGGANLLVNITNDAWFGRSSAPHQHLSMAALRAVENRIPIARCANTGISAFIDTQGQILQKTGLYEDATLLATLQLGNGKTFYTRHGDWFAWLCVAITVLVFGYSLTRMSGKETGVRR